jgi:autoinducer 2 (AI-2) kinase
VKNHRPEVFNKVAKLSMISDWILFKLSGMIASEPSNAGTTGIFSLSGRTWEKSMLERVGIDASILPEVVESGEVIGHVSHETTQMFGFDANTIVVAGGGDVQLGTIGLGLIEEAQTAILGGSFWQQVVNIKSETPPPLDLSVRVNPHVSPGYSQAEGITFFSGLIMRWFRDTIGGGRSYQELERLAQEVPVGSHGIMPIFSDSMKYGRWYHAAPSFLNLTIDPDKTNVGSMFRSLQENAAIVSALNLKKIEAFAPTTSDEIIFAAGASKGELWPHILSSVTGRVIKIPKVKEATSLGGAMLALKALNHFKTLKEATSLVSFEREVEPKMEEYKRYQEIGEQWQTIYNRELALVDEGLTNSMWRAPGV